MPRIHLLLQSGWLILGALTVKRLVPQLCGAIMALLLGTTVRGETLHVPSPRFVVIQDAIDAALDGDTVAVADGVWSGFFNKDLNLQGKAITITSENGSDNCTIDCEGVGRAFIAMSGEARSTVINGFTIINGNGDVGQTVGSGGGIRCLSSSPTISNCVLSSNTANTGGGIACLGGSTALIINCTFSANTAVGGAAMDIVSSSPTLSGCRFLGNSAPFAAAIRITSTSSPSLTNCIFSNNSATSLSTGNGGAIRIQSGVNRPTFTSCLFVNNSGTCGGAISNVFGSRPVFSNCIFRGNQAVKRGGAISNEDTSEATIVGCTFFNNSAGEFGGAVRQASSFGGTVTNCILWQNSPDQIGVELSSPPVVVRYSDIEGGFNGLGNIDADPLFVDAVGADSVLGTEEDNLRLLSGSPCINAGEPALIPGPTVADLDGHARVLCMRVDMGAYEFGIGDFDCDQIVTLTDFADWAGCMTAPDAQSILPACEAFDFEFDSDVDLIDWAGFQNAFTGS